MDKEQLKQKFFDECTDVYGQSRKINIAPHDLFKWIESNCLQKQEENNNAIEQDEKIFKLAELLSDEAYGDKGVYLYSERQELSVRLNNILQQHFKQEQNNDEAI